MSSKYTFEQALQILEIDASAGPRNAKRALMLQLQRHGPEPSAEDYARFTQAYEVLEHPSAWPDYEPPETYDDDLVPRTRRRLPPGHQRSQRERPAAASPPPADHAWSEEPAQPASRPRSARPQAHAPQTQDNPFLTAEPAHSEGAPVNAEAAVSALLEDDAVVTVLARLEKNYGSVLPRDELLRHMAQSSEDEVTVYLSRLFEGGQVMATGAAVAGLLDLMGGEKSYKFLHSRGVVKLLLGVFAKCDTDARASSVGASIQRAYDRWATASELNPPSLDISTRDALRISRSLAALPEEFPPELLAATARAAQRGDLTLVRSDFQTWVDAYEEQADELRRILARSAPAILKVVADLFPDRDSQAALGRATAAKHKKFAIRALVAALVLGAAWYATREDAFETAERKVLLDASRDLCDFAGRDHAVCMLGKQLLDALPTSNCIVIEPIVPQFVSAVHSMKNNAGRLSSAVDLGAVNAAKRKADKLVIAAQTKCAGI